MAEQEPRKEQVAAAVTASEKRRIQLTANALDKDVSSLLRLMSVDDAITRGEEIQAQFKEIEAVA